MSLYSRPTAKRGRSQPASRIGSSLQRVIKSGAIAQLGERFNGIEEVVGSIPSGSTKILLKNQHFSYSPKLNPSSVLILGRTVIASYLRGGVMSFALKCRAIN